MIKFDIGSCLVGILIGIVIVFAVIWIYIYGENFFNQYKELLCGVILGGSLVWAIYNIDWSVGF